jgi:hypothetical protein
MTGIRLFSSVVAADVVAGAVVSQEARIKKAPRKCGVFFGLYPRLVAAGANVDPLGSCMTGASVFPEKFLGLVAIRPAEPAVKPLKGRAA